MNCEKEAIKRYLRAQKIPVTLDNATLLRIVATFSAGDISALDIPSLLGVDANDINNAASAVAGAPWWQDEGLTPTRKPRPSEFLRPGNNDRTLRKRSPAKTSPAKQPPSDDSSPTKPADIWSRYKIEERPWRANMSTTQKPPSPEEEVSIWARYNIEERPWQHKMSKTARPPPKEEEPPDRATLRQSRPRPWKRGMKVSSPQKDGRDGEGSDEDGGDEEADGAGDGGVPVDELDRAAKREQRPRPWVANMKTGPKPKQEKAEVDRKALRESRPKPWQSHMRKKPRARDNDPPPSRAELRANRPRPWVVASKGSSASPAKSTVKKKTSTKRTTSQQPAIAGDVLKALADVSLDSTVATNNSSDVSKDPMNLVKAAEAASGSDDDSYGGDDDYSDDDEKEDAASKEAPNAAATADATGGDGAANGDDDDYGDDFGDDYSEDD